MDATFNDLHGFDAISTNKSKIAVFFDDQQSTIKRHVEHAKKLNIDVLIPENEQELLSLMEVLSDKAIFFVDMHVPNLYNMASLDYENIDTLRCSAFATAIFKVFLLKFQKAIRFPYILSGRPIAEKALNTISDLEDDNFPVRTLEKGDEQFEEFEHALQLYVESDLSGVQSTSVIEEKFIVVQKMIGDWFPESEVTASKIFGFSDLADYEQALVNEKLFTIGVEDTCDALYRIKKNLVSIYNDDVEREKKWLANKMKAFDGASPKEILETGHQHNIYMILAFLERM